MTEEQNKALVRTFIDAINRKDWQQFNDLVAPNFVRHSSTFGQSKINTREDLQRYLAEEFKTFPDALETIHFMVAEADKVAVHSRCLATQQGPLGPFPALGKQLSADFISVYRVADGRIVEAWTEWDCLNGLIQLGHMSPPS